MIESAHSDEDNDFDEDATPPGEQFSFPQLDEQIRNVISKYGAVFPKLNFSSPKVHLPPIVCPGFLG